MPIYTRTGDEGTTGLFGGGRVPKNHVRVSAYGDVDELNAAIGVARATPPADLAEPLLEAIQRDLFALGGHLATPDTAKVAKALERATLSESHVLAFDLARTVCRRAERSVVRLAHEDPLPALFTVYLNRLSDLLFTLARLANHRAGVGDVTW